MEVVAEVHVRGVGDAGEEKELFVRKRRKLWMILVTKKFVTVKTNQQRMFLGLQWNIASNR